MLIGSPEQRYQLIILLLPNMVKELFSSSTISKHSVRMGRCCSLHRGTVVGKVSVLLLNFTRLRGELCKTRHPNQSLIAIQRNIVLVSSTSNSNERIKSVYIYSRSRSYSPKDICSPFRRQGCSSSHYSR